MEIDGVVEGDPGMAALMRGLESAGAKLHASSRMQIWFRPREANWEDHLRGFSKTHRRRIRRWIEATGDDAPFQQRTAETEAQAVAWVGSLIEMHQQRWTAAGQAGSFESATFRKFIIEAACSFLSRGQLFVTVLESGGEPIAAELNLIGGDRVVYSYSSGFDTRHADQEPGRVLAADTLRQLYQCSLAGIDYLRGDEIYKQRYSTQSRRLMQLRIVAPALAARLRHAAWQTQFELKQWARKRTGRQPVLVLDPTSDIGNAAPYLHAAMH
jgi:CelD/BcsL family acetyltransferase involved in cellulose biosynthesis